MNKIFKNKLFPFIPQVIMLVAFAYIIANAWGVVPETKAVVKTLRNTNLGNLAVWSFWWPLIVVTAVIFGRWWCTVCPMELVNSLTSMIGLKRKPGKFLSSGWFITVFYAIIMVVIVQTFITHRIPHRMALYLSGLALLALLSGLIFEKRTFCNYICPVGHLLGLYSMLSFFGLKVKSKETCLSCKTKDCFDSKKHYKLTARSCTSNLNPSKNSPTIQCVNCTQCMSACPHDNLNIKTKSPLSRFVNFQLKPAQAAFLLLVSGFLIPELLEDNKALFNFLAAPAFALTENIDAGYYLGRFIEKAYFIIGFPLVIWGIVSILNSIIFKLKPLKSLSQLGLYLLPTVAFLHAYKGITKVIKRLPYIPHAFNDTKGIDTANKIVAGDIEVNSKISEMLLPTLNMLAPIIVMIAFFIVMAIFKRNKPKYHSISLTFACLFALGFAIALSL